ncbi:MAG: type III PLP-dependent enzyme [Alphaproteobacteria bacterium]
MHKTALNTAKRSSLDTYRDAGELVLARRPAEPIYCFYRHVVRACAQEFLSGFPGDVLYAVKSNPAPVLIDALYAAGLRHFDTASLPEIRLVRERLPDARCYFMAPVRPMGAAGEAYRRWGVKDFVLDSEEELQKTLAETAARDLTLYVRLKTDVGGAVLELSSKFGAHEIDAVKLLKRVAESGCRVGIAFHVGSLCLDAEAFERALEICRGVLALANVPIHAVDVGGGFPAPYPGTAAPPLSEYFERIKAGAATLNLGDKVRLICEPGRGLSARHVARRPSHRPARRPHLPQRRHLRHLRRDDDPQLALHLSGARHAIEGERVRRINSTHKSFIAYGPTCDPLDVLPHPLELRRAPRPATSSSSASSPLPTPTARPSTASIPTRSSRSARPRRCRRA